MYRRLTRGSYASESAEDTQSFGHVLGTLVEEGDLIFLDGELGAGKTQFTKGLAEALGIARSVTSPTFALENVYEEGRIPLFHYDLYRLENEYQLEDIDIFDVAGASGVATIEWGLPFADAISQERLMLTFARDLSVSDTYRTIEMLACGARAEELLEAFDTKVRA